VIWVFDYFLCCSYRHNFLNFWISYLFRPTSLSYYGSKLSNVWEKSTFQIRQNYLALVGFLPEPDFCQIWKKCRIPTRAGTVIRYSPRDRYSAQLQRGVVDQWSWRCYSRCRFMRTRALSVLTMSPTHCCCRANMSMSVSVSVPVSPSLLWCHWSAPDCSSLRGCQHVGFRVLTLPEDSLQAPELLIYLLTWKASKLVNQALVLSALLCTYVGSFLASLLCLGFFCCSWLYTCV